MCVCFVHCFELLMSPSSASKLSCRQVYMTCVSIHWNILTDFHQIITSGGVSR